VVLPHSVVDNSTFSPKWLDKPLGLAYSSFQELSMLIISGGEDPMTFHVFWFFLLFLLLLSLAWLGRLYWLHHGLPDSRARVVHRVVHRLRHRHGPHTIARPVAFPPLSHRL
jgi:hypothetical protein